MLPVGLCPESTVYHGYQVLQYHVIERRAIQSALLIHISSRTWTERSLNIAAIHHYQHRHTLSGSYQIVHNVIHPSLCAPAGFILAHAVLQIKYGIAFLGTCLILGRCIDHAAAEFLLRFRIVSARTHLPMRHSLPGTIIIPFLALGNLYATGHTATTEEGIAGRINYRNSVHHQEIIMESHH